MLVCEDWYILVFIWNQPTCIVSSRLCHRWLWLWPPWQEHSGWLDLDNNGAPSDNSGLSNSDGGRDGACWVMMERWEAGLMVRPNDHMVAGDNDDGGYHHHYHSKTHSAVVLCESYLYFGVFQPSKGWEPAKNYVVINDKIISILPFNLSKATLTLWCILWVCIWDILEHF